MRLKYSLLLFLFVLSSCATSQKSTNSYGLYVVSEIETYNESIVENKNNVLVDLQTLIPDVVLDIRYATKNNFTKEQVYTKSKAYLRYPAAMALRKVQEELKQYGLGIKIYDGYRPYSATIKFWNLIKDSRFVANPKNGSRHNRGCAIDLSLIVLDTKKEVLMPTEYDNFTEKAGAFYNIVSEEAKKNREILQSVMTKNNFIILTDEWWHFDYEDWKEYDILDLSFEQLEELY